MNAKKGISFVTVFGIIIAIICALLIGFSLGQFAKTTEVITFPIIETNTLIFTKTDTLTSIKTLRETETEIITKFLTKTEYVELTITDYVKERTKGSIELKIVDSLTGKPISGAKVRIESSFATTEEGDEETIYIEWRGGEFTKISDSNGIVIFDDVDAGNVTFSIHANGYKEKTISVFLPAHAEKVIYIIALSAS